MGQRALAEHYVLEVATRASWAINRCDALLAEQYVTDAPLVLARTVRKICEFLSRAATAIASGVDWERCDRSEFEREFIKVRAVDELLQHVASHLQFVESTRTEKLPWSTIPAFIKLVNTLLPNTDILLRPEWAYNYFAHVEDLRSTYLTALEELAQYVPDTRLVEDVLGEMPGAFQIVAFPALEQKNILLHCLLGHEIGHVFAHRFLDRDRADSFATRVRLQIDELTANQVSSTYGELFEFAQKQTLFAENLEQAKTYWTRALEEIISDLTGALLFGPAALFSTMEMALQEGYDEAPSQNKNYPPWRLRLWEVLGIVQGPARASFPVAESVLNGDGKRAARVNAAFQVVQDVASALIPDESDERGHSDKITRYIAEIDDDPLVAIAYREVLADLPAATAYLFDNCGLDQLRFHAKSVYGTLPLLLERLDHGIPPNEIGVMPNGSPGKTASLVEIINAAWFYKVSMVVVETPQDGSPASSLTSVLPDKLVERNRLNNLTLKAIEYAGLSDDLTAWQMRKVPVDDQKQ